MSPLSNALRDTNHRLRFWLETMVPASGQPMVATPEYLTALLSELLRAGANLRAEPSPTNGHDPELDVELATYRSHVERLRDLLPSIHSLLLSERARIEAQRTRVRSAAQWARASRQTL
jgi:hypothetical protein